MSKIKKAFSNWRDNTPKRAQWLLLAVAFIVVLILLTMLLVGGDKDQKIEDIDTGPAELIISPDSVDWADVLVGQTRTQTIKVSATGPIAIMAVRRTQDINGLSVNTGCTNAGEINEQFACTITVDYAPTTAMSAKAVPVFIDWRGINQPEEMKKTYKYTMVLGATSPQIEKPEPIIVEKVIEKIIEKPVEVPVNKVNTEKEIEEKSLDLIAPVKPFGTVTETADNTISEGCSDFAFPGYDNSGKQIGWIKPKAGAYYFHPFSDKECKNATGVYNPDNGIITDIKNSSKKIGTDADHIGYGTITTGTLPKLASLSVRQTEVDEKPANEGGMARLNRDSFSPFSGLKDAPKPDVEYVSSGEDTVVSSKIHDRQFLLRQYKPIPATIVSDVRADAEALERGVPVRATVDRNVYSDSGRNVIIPTGTMMLGYVTGNLPGPYTSVGRMQINWYQFILPNGVEFNFAGDEKDPFSADSQGRVGVPGYGSTDYLEQFVMPMLTAIVPAAVNLIAPVTDAFVNQIDLDNNTVVQSGTVRSSELAKNEIITAWNQVAQKLLVDMMDNTVPPFTIAAGTRINVYSPVDLMVTCGAPGSSDKKCAVAEYGSNKRADWEHSRDADYDDGSWVGQVRSFAVDQCCTDGRVTNPLPEECKTYDYRTLVFYCQSNQYRAINMAKQDAVFQSQQQKFQKQYEVDNTGAGLTGIQGNQAYNEQVLGLTYDEEGYIENPFEKKPAPVVEEVVAPVLTCEDGSLPDGNGCCAGEIYTDMGEQGFNCCPETGGDCFPPIL